MHAYRDNVYKKISVDACFQYGIDYAAEKVLQKKNMHRDFS